MQDRRVDSPDVDVDDPDDLGGSEKCTSASVVTALNPGLSKEISIFSIMNSLTLEETSTRINVRNPDQ